jgi:hypothetical protein
MNCSRKHILYLIHYAKENNFSFPNGFLKKTAQWHQRHYNGIGAEWMPSRLRKNVTKALRHMEPHALLHDFEFLQNNKSYWNFTKANFRLWVNGIKSRHIWSGFVLFVICQLFAWSAWKEGKETMAYYYYYKGDEKK